MTDPAPEAYRHRTNLGPLVTTTLCDPVSTEDLRHPATPRKLALLITELDPGGAERALVELAVGLDRTRYAAEVICLGPLPTGARALLVDRLQRHGLPLTCLGHDSPLGFVAALRQLRERWQKHRPDLIQTWLYHANILGRLAARGLGVPIVCGVRVAEPRRWQLYSDRLTRSLVTRYVAVSRAVADYHCHAIGTPAETMVVIGNGVDVRRYQQAAPWNPAAEGLPHDRRRLVAVGRLEPQKGLDRLLDALAPWLRATAGWELLLVGDGPERTRLIAQAQRLNISDSVRLLGWRSDVESILTGCELLVLASRWEGMPNVVLEAMAAGRAVAALAVEGVVEILGDEAANQTAPADDLAGLVQVIVRLAANDELRRSLGQANQLRAQTQFSWQRMAEAYTSLYDQLLKIQPAAQRYDPSPGSMTPREAPHS